MRDDVFAPAHRRKKVSSAEPKDEVTHGAKHVTAFCRLT
jgi:hypothetical protein